MEEVFKETECLSLYIENMKENRFLLNVTHVRFAYRRHKFLFNEGLIIGQ